LVWQLLHQEFYPPLLLANQAVISCSKYNCGGGDFDVLDFIKNKGLPVETDYPYTASNGSCKSYTPFMKITRWAYVGNGKGEPTTEQIKQAIYDHGPISVDVAANGSWSGYKSGVYNACNSSGINHMVALVGWDDTDGKGYWYLLNSWGTDWGENGYMKTRYTGSGSSKCNSVGETTAYAIVDGVENLREHLGIRSGVNSK
jgi:C1A family cysteine protease